MKRLLIGGIAALASGIGSLLGAGLANADAYYKNCDVAREMKVTPLHRGDPGYGPHLDQDGDGVACQDGVKP